MKGGKVGLVEREFHRGRTKRTSCDTEETIQCRISVNPTLVSYRVGRSRVPRRDGRVGSDRVESVCTRYFMGNYGDHLLECKRKDQKTKTEGHPNDNNN